MDYLAHGIWSWIFFHRYEKTWIGVLFGLLADSSSWLVYSVYRIFFTGTMGPPVLDQIPQWAFTLYGLSHSLVVSLTVVGLLYLFYRKIFIYSLAWPIAVTIDLFTHTRDFLPTPFLWPISDWTFPGISWANPTFMITNYVLILCALGIIFYQRKYAIEHRKK